MNRLFSLIILCSSLGTFAQELPKIPKDDPQARYEFDQLRLRNPVTKEIPQNMRFRELNFAKTLAANSRSDGVPSRWDHRGPYNVGGRTRALAVDVNSSEMTILAGGVSGGVWKSINQGASWTKTTSSGDIQSVTAIAQDTRSGQTDVWYYGTGEKRGNSAGGSSAFFSGSGIFKSTDGGNVWSLLASTSDNLPQDDSDDFDYNHEIIVNPVNGDVYVANEGGIYRSQNGGTSFSIVLNDFTGGWSDVVISSTGVVFAAIDDRGIFKSTTGDLNSWMEISSGTGITKTNGERKELSLATSNEDILYMIGESSGGHMLWRFDDSDDSWIDRSANIPALGGLTGDFTSLGGYALLIKVQPTDENFIVIGGTNLFRSVDGFATSINSPRTNNPNWIGGYTSSNRRYNFYLSHHADQHAFVFLSGNKALSGNDGGVQLTNDVTSTSVSWNWLNNGYLTTQSYAVSVGPGDQIMSGFQDNSTWLTTSTNPTTSWTDQLGGDGAYNAFSSDGTTRYLSAQFATIFRINYGSADSHSPTGTTSFTPRSGYRSALFITPFYLDPQDDDLFYLAGNPVFYVNNKASTGNDTEGWFRIPLNNSGVFTEIGVTYFNQVLVGTHIGELFRITDPGGSPVTEEITGSNFPSAYISGIASNPFNPYEILVCFSNYEVQSVFHTSDGGTNWTHVSGNLEENENGSGDGPSARMTAIVGNGDKYFVATSTGLYSTTSINGSSTVWMREDPSGIGNAVVEHLASRTDGLIVAGTHANGIYSSNVDIQNFLSDLAIIHISAPIDGVLGVENVKATVSNVGSLTQSSFDISLYVNDHLVVTDAITTPLQGLELYEHSFSQTFDFGTSGIYEIRVEVDLTGDNNTSNDVYSKQVETFSTLSSFPYVESFESDDHGWMPSGIWELGSPSTSLLSGVSDDTRAWVTDIDSNYPNNESATIESPYFDFTNLVTPRITFDINYSIEAGFDGVVFGYRVGSNDDYTIIFDNSNTTNWYSGNARVFAHDAWQGSTSGSYVSARVDATILAGINGIQFAMIFKSDGETTGEGTAFDNFRIFEKNSPADIQLTSSQIDENQPSGTIVGTFSTVDADDTEHIYTLIDSESFGNSSFTIDNDKLTSAEEFDFEVKSLYTIKVVTADDDGNEFAKILTIEIINDESDDPLAVNDLTKNGISIFPNPARHRLNLDMTNDYLGPVKVTIFSIEGKRTVVKRTVNKSGYSLKGLFDLNTLSKGLYILKFTMGDRVLTGKIIKE